MKRMKRMDQLNLAILQLCNCARRQAPRCCSDTRPCARFPLELEALRETRDSDSVAPTAAPPARLRLYALRVTRSYWLVDSTAYRQPPPISPSECTPPGVGGMPSRASKCRRRRRRRLHESGGRWGGGIFCRSGAGRLCVGTLVSGDEMRWDGMSRDWLTAGICVDGDGRVLWGCGGVHCSR